MMEFMGYIRPDEIGIATADIKKGEYVHVHNLDSMRGRGDWAEKAAQ